MKKLSLALLAVIATACSRESSRPFNHGIGTITVEGVDYHSALIIQHEPDGIHAVGGLISDAPLPKITVGPDNSQKAPLQIIPSEGIIVHNGKKIIIEQDGQLIWIIGGKMYEQTLEGFPLEADLKQPKEIPNKSEVATP